MAKIVENQAGRRLIRLSHEDILAVVNIYQQHLHRDPEPQNASELQSRLAEHPLYLPEEV